MPSFGNRNPSDFSINQVRTSFKTLNKSMPEEPRLFSMAHELKHHLVDHELARTRLLECAADFSSRSPIEIGAEVFAAEFLFPEAEFVEWVDAALAQRPCGIDDVVRLKRNCPAKVSYAFLAKRLERLRYAPTGSLQGAHFQKREYELFGVPFYLRFRKRAAKSRRGGST